MLPVKELSILWNLLTNLPSPSSETTAFSGAQNHAAEESKLHLHGGGEAPSSIPPVAAVPLPLFLEFFQPSGLQDSWFTDSQNHLVSHASISN